MNTRRECREEVVQHDCVNKPSGRHATYPGVNRRFRHCRQVPRSDTKIEELAGHDLIVGCFVAVKVAGYLYVKSVGSICGNCKHRPLARRRFDLITFHETPSYREYRQEGAKHESPRGRDQPPANVPPATGCQPPAGSSAVTPGRSRHDR